MTCSSRLYKGDSYEICLPLDTGITTVRFYTRGDVVIEKEADENMCFLLTKEELDLLPDGVLRYSYEGIDTNTDYYLKTPDDYSGSTIEEVIAEAYESGYTQGLEECSGGSEDLIANLQGDYYIIPEGTNKIRDYAFYYQVFPEITIPDSVEYIGNYAFGGNYDVNDPSVGLQSIVIPDSVTGMGYGVFYACQNLTSATISNSIEDLPSFTFNGCDLTGITIPDNIKTIGGQAFSGCHNLTGITIPSGVKELKSSCFSNCYALSAVTLPDNLETIENGVFSRCSGLTEITIPSSVTSIGETCFYSAGLTGITIHDGPTEIGRSTFYACPLTSVVLPDSVVTLGSAVFQYCDKLTEIVLPSGLTEIGVQCFSDCESLTGITIPSSVTTFQTSVFRNCHSLKEINLSNGLTTIGRTCFLDCESLTGITIPSSVTSIGASCFWNCSGLTEMVFEGTTPPVLGGKTTSDGSLGQHTYTFPIYVPCESVQAYKTASGWSMYANRITCREG